MCSNTILLPVQRLSKAFERVLTDNEAAVRTDHVPRSVVLHQDGIRVIGTLDSGQAQGISATDTKHTTNDQHSKERLRQVTRIS